MLILLLTSSRINLRYKVLNKRGRCMTCRWCCSDYQWPVSSVQCITGRQSKNLGRVQRANKTNNLSHWLRSDCVSPGSIETARGMKSLELEIARPNDVYNSSLGHVKARWSFALISDEFICYLQSKISLSQPLNNTHYEFLGVCTLHIFGYRHYWYRSIASWY